MQLFTPRIIFLSNLRHWLASNFKSGGNEKCSTAHTHTHIQGDRHTHMISAPTHSHSHLPSAKTSSTVTVTRPTVKTLPTKLFVSFEEEVLCEFSNFSFLSNFDRIFFIFILFFYCLRRRRRRRQRQLYVCVLIANCERCVGVCQRWACQASQTARCRIINANFFRV